MRYVFNVGDLVTCDDLSKAALERWTADSGPDDPNVLVLAGTRADLLWTQGDYEATYELRASTLERMRRVFGEQHEEYLLVINGHGADLRARGDFAGSLELSYREVYGDRHPYTYACSLNLAIVRRRIGEVAQVPGGRPRRPPDRARRGPPLHPHLPDRAGDIAVDHRCGRRGPPSR